MMRVLLSLLILAQIGLATLVLVRFSGQRQVAVLMPLVPLSGQEVEAELAAAGVRLPADPSRGDPETYGRRVARALGRTAYLGPSMAVDDFVSGIEALSKSPEHGPFGGQARERKLLLDRLQKARDRLDGSSRQARDLAARLRCARVAIMARLRPDELSALGGKPAPGGKAPAGGER